MFMRLAKMATLIVGTFALASCGINSVPTKEEAAKAAWANVESAYQRRADLIPNLVSTVRGAAAAGAVGVRHTGAETTLGELEVLLGVPARD